MRPKNKPHVEKRAGGNGASVASALGGPPAAPPPVVARNREPVRVVEFTRSNSTGKKSITEVYMLADLLPD